MHVGFRLNQQFIVALCIYQPAVPAASNSGPMSLEQEERRLVRALQSYHEQDMKRAKGKGKGKCKVKGREPTCPLRPTGELAEVTQERMFRLRD